MKNQKLILFITFLFCLIEYEICAQTKHNISIMSGFTDYETIPNSYSINYNYLNDNSVFELGFNASFFQKNYLIDNETYKGKFDSYSINAGYLYSLVRTRNNTYFLNTGLGLLGGYDLIKDNTNIVTTSKNGPMFGSYVAIDMSYFLSDSFGLVLRGQQNILFKSSTGRFNPVFSLGVKFNL